MKYNVQLNIKPNMFCTVEIGTLNRAYVKIFDNTYTGEGKSSNTNTTYTSDTIECSVQEVLGNDAKNNRIYFRISNYATEGILNAFATVETANPALTGTNANNGKQDYATGYDKDSFVYAIPCYVASTAGVGELSILPNVVDQQNITITLTLDIEDYSNYEVVYNNFDNVNFEANSHRIRNDIDYSTTLTAKTGTYLPKMLNVQKVSTEEQTTSEIYYLTGTNETAVYSTIAPTPTSDPAPNATTATFTIDTYNDSTTPKTTVNGNYVVSPLLNDNVLLTFDTYTFDDLTLRYSSITYAKDSTLFVPTNEDLSLTLTPKISYGTTGSKITTANSTICAEVLVWTKGATGYQWVSLNSNNYSVNRTTNPATNTTEYCTVTINQKAITGNLKVKASIVEIVGGDANTSFSHGTGTQNDPYQIWTDKDFNYFLSHIEYNKNYILKNNIILNDVSSYSSWGTTAPTKPTTSLCNDNNGFQGCFDGNGFVICGLYSENGGFFAKVFNNGCVKNLGLIFSYIKTSTAGAVGSIANELTSETTSAPAQMQNCYNTGILASTTATHTGGLAGAAITKATTPGSGDFYAFIENCYSNGTFGTTATGSNIGGICGEFCFSKVTNCFNYSNVSGNVNTGGIVGSSANTPFEQNVNFGNVYSTGGNIGGIVGNIYKYYNDSTKQTLEATERIENNFNLGIISTKSINTTNIGGIAGTSANALSNCVNCGVVFGKTEANVGGIAGTSSKSGSNVITKCFNVGEVFNGYSICKTATGTISYCASVREFKELAPSTTPSNPVISARPASPIQKLLVSALDYDNFKTKSEIYTGNSLTHIIEKSIIEIVNDSNFTTMFNLLINN